MSHLYIWSALSTPPMCMLYRVTTAGQHTSFCVPSLHLVCPVDSTHVHVVQSDNSRATHVFLGFHLYIWSALSTPPMCMLYRVTTAGQHTSFCVPSLHLVCPVYSTHVHVVQSDNSRATHVFLCPIFTSGLPCLLHPCACCTE